MSLRYRNQSEAVDIDLATLLRENAVLAAQQDTPMEPVEAPRLGLGFALIGVGILTLIAFMAFDVGQTLYQAWLITPGLAIGLGLVAGLFLALLSVFSWRELASYWQIRRLPAEQIQRRNQFDSQQNKALETLLHHLLRVQRHSPQARKLIERYQASVEARHNTQDRWTIYQHTVAEPLREQALSLISQESLKLGGATALSVHTSLQLALMLWRSLRLLKRLAQLYGYRSGLAANGLLLKISVENMLLHVALDQTSEELMGQSLVGKLSQQAATGLSAGLLVRRLGMAALDLLQVDTRSTATNEPQKP